MTASVVQRVTNGQPNGNGSWAPSGALGSTPTQGNLLYAVIIQLNSGTSPVAASGWTVDASFNSGSTYCTSFYKYAGASESTTQTPTTTTGAAGSIVIWEVSGTYPIYSAAKLAFATNTFSGGTQYIFGNTTNNKTLVLGATVGYTAAAPGVGTASLSHYTLASQYNAVGGTGNVTMQATAGEFFATNAGTSANDTFSYTLAINTAQIYVQFLSLPFPPNTLAASKINAWAMTGPPNGVQVVSKITAYTMIGPPPTGTGWISVME